MKNEEYWTKRKANLIYEQMDKAEKQADKFDEIYRQSKTYLDKQINKVFDKFQRDYGLSERDARQVLKNMKDQKDLNELRKVLEARPNDPNIQRLLADLDSPAYAYRMKRLERLNDDLDRMRESIYHSEKVGSDTFYSDLMKDSYYKATFDLQQQTGLAYSFSNLPETEIKRLRELKWTGEGYSDRIWSNTGALASSVKDELLVSLMTGRSVRDTSQAIAERFGVGQNNARRLIRTESAFFHNQMELLSYEDAEIIKYKFVAVLDRRTSHICQEHDNKVYDTDKAVPGVNYPPLHPWCRSTTIAHDEDADYSKLERRARNPETGKTELVPADMSYDEWYSKYVDGKEVVKESKSEVADKVFVADKPNEIDDFFKKQKSYQKWYNELTDEEKNAIYTYTKSDYHNFNNIKRFGIDKAFKLSEEFWLEEHGEADLNLALERVREANTKIPFLEKALSDFAPEKSFKVFRGTGSVSALGEDLGYMDLEVGQKLTLDKSFTSFSLDKNYAREFAIDGDGANILFEVTVKKGQKTGAYIAELSDFNPEKEYLMKPNLKYNVISKKETEDGLLVYGLEVLENGS
ncbi:minor capsid protein [Streptococcus oralis]|uniref:Minor capsid protein n=1 Tax=Streptococcus oralis TaxID=1303 RepID=A0AAW5WC01_STROR|nr:minor capsid protein [Streptococcus oralis]MCY7060158.1 minor capsid protein [Streptococcus oralis]DAP38995.1 MAG TPA: minor capsid protein [Caudoviricetes sp.]